MIMDTVIERFTEQTPITVMARLSMQRALDPDWIDALFEQHRQSQYTRELLFSTTVELMSLVAVGLRPSLHAAAKACKDLPVSMSALYDKVNRTDPDLVRALMAGSATTDAGGAADVARTGALRRWLSLAYRRWQPFAGQRETHQAAA